MYNCEICNLGVTVSNDRIKAAVLAPGCDWCQILVRKAEKPDMEWTAYKLDKSGLFPSVYMGCFTVDDAGGELEYIFENENGFFLDPYARRLKGNESFGIIKPVIADSSDKRRIFADTMGYTCVVENSTFDWKNDRKPCISYSDMIIYKLHVRGFTMSKTSGVKHPGTYKGISEKLTYLKNLGINAILLQPCYEFSELMDYNICIGSGNSSDVIRSRFFGGPENQAAEESSRVNFWGYGTQAFYYAPKSLYASEKENAVNEFKSLIFRCHEAGIEVLMEFDYGRNVTDSFILENLRFWAGEYHIDGFRFCGGNVPVRLIMGDAYLSNLKLIVSSADDSMGNGFLSHDGLGAANDCFQDTMRRFLKGDEGQLNPAIHLFREKGEYATRINYIADHNGFTLNDCFCYDERHNEANGERNCDGREANYSWNCGAEGATRKRKILDLRNKMIRNALTVTLLAQGTPMLYAGDEFGNTHSGNNNPYCQDNEQGWVNWDRSKRANEFLKLVRQLISLKTGHRVLCNTSRLMESDFDFTGYPDISFHGTRAWYPDFNYYSRSVGILLNGKYAENRDGKKDISFYIIMNMHWEEHEFDLPMLKDRGWKPVLSTDPSFEYKEISGKWSEKHIEYTRTAVVRPRSIVVFREIKGEEDE